MGVVYTSIIGTDAHEREHLCATNSTGLWPPIGGRPPKSKCCLIFGCNFIYSPNIIPWAIRQPLFKWFIQRSKVFEIFNSWVHNLSLLSTQRCTTFIKCENWNGDNSENDSQSVTGIELSKSAVPSTNVGADINIPSSDIQKVCPRISELYICKRG